MIARLLRVSWSHREFRLRVLKMVGSLLSHFTGLQYEHRRSHTTTNELVSQHVKCSAKLACDCQKSLLPHAVHKAPAWPLASLVTSPTTQQRNAKTNTALTTSHLSRCTPTASLVLSSPFASMARRSLSTLRRTMT